MLKTNVITPRKLNTSYIQNDTNSTSMEIENCAFDSSNKSSDSDMFQNSNEIRYINSSNNSSAPSNGDEFHGLNYDPDNTEEDPELSDNEFNPYGSNAIEQRKMECLRLGIEYNSNISYIPSCGNKLKLGEGVVVRHDIDYF